MNHQEPRVYAPQKQFPWLVIIVLLLISGALVWFLFLNKPQPPARITSVQPSDIKRQEVKEVAVKPVEEKPPPPPPIIPETPPKQSRYKITYKRSDLFREGPGKFCMRLHCEFSDPTNDQTIYGIGSGAPARELTTSSGKVAVDPWGFGSPTKLNNHKANMSVTVFLNDHDSKIVRLDGEVGVVRLAERKQLEMPLDGEPIGKSVSMDGFSFTVSNFQSANDRAQVELFSRTKPELAGQPQITAQYNSFFEFKLRFSDGSQSGISGGSGGGMGNGRYIHDMQFPLKGRTPQALVISYVPTIDVELAPFTLTDIDVPAREETPVAAQPIKRGPRSVISNGYTFQLNRVELLDHQEPSTSFSFEVTPPANVQIVESEHKIIGALARDDKGAEMKSYGQTFMLSVQDKVYLNATFRYPDAEASSIETLTGTFKGIAADEMLTQEFDVTQTVTHTKPVTQGPVSLNRFRIIEDVATYEISVEKSVLAPAKNQHNFVQYELRDAAGNVIKRTGGGGYPNPTHLIIRLNQVLNGVVPAKLVVKYVTKTKSVEVPFEFKDIEIPRAAKKIEFAKPDEPF